MTVAIPGRSYDVVIGSGLLDAADASLPDLGAAAVAFVIADRAMGASWFPRLEAPLARRGLKSVLLAVPSGEDAKTLAVYGTLVHQLASQEAHRDDVVVALGGGTTGDLAGFVAATYMRGLPFVQIPTTLTAQVDAAIGGKNGVNLPEGKNLVGTFAQPIAVLVDVDTLATLDDGDYRAGLAEVAKYALTLDLTLLAQLEGDPSPVLTRDPAVLTALVARCVAAKARTVVADERDTGARVFLNYGHTLGHALERLEAFRGRTHGEAIAVGMVFAARLSEARGIAGDGLTTRTVRLLKALGLETAGDLPAASEVLAAMRMDKKYQGGLRFVLLEDVGRPIVVEGVTDDEIGALLVEMGADG